MLCDSKNLARVQNYPDINILNLFLVLIMVMVLVMVLVISLVKGLLNAHGVTHELGVSYVLGLGLGQCLGHSHICILFG